MLNTTPKPIPTLALSAEQPLGIGAFYQARVMQVTARDEAGNVTAAEPVTDWTDPVHNLILPAGFNPDANWGRGQIGNRFHAGTGTTPNSAAIDGTYSQTGTTVTRSSGTGVFTSGMVNDFIKFGTGERAKVVTFTNSTTVEVDRTQTVAATTLTVYDCSRTSLDTWVKDTTSDDGSAGFEGFTNDTAAGTIRYWFTKNFAVETSARTYTEVGTSSSGTGSGAVLFSRALLDTPVNVDIDQFLQLRVDSVITMGNCRVATAITPAITGWPYPYTITDITSNGTYWDVTTSANHHFLSGRPINIENALPVTQAISSISSTVSDFTVNTATAHGRTAGDSVVIAGATPAGYNGTHTIATVVDADTYTVTSGINLGAGSGGTSRLATPATWYNGTHTIASVPAANKIRITNANSIVQAGSGTLKNNLNATAIVTGFAFTQLTNTGTGNTPFDISNTGQGTYAIPEASLKTGLQYGVPTTTTGALAGTPTMNRGTYTVASRSRTYSVTFTTAQANSTSIRQISIGGGQGLWITFDEVQRKDNGFQLALTYTLSWEPDLV